MSQKRNKVRYGLCNVYFAIATLDAINNTATYGTPIRWPGAVNLSQEPQGGTTIFRADNIDYWIGQSNTGYQGDFESALIPDEFRKQVLGEVEDSNGVLVENSGAKTVYFALMFQIEGDQKNRRFVLYKCSATRASVAGETTDTEITPNTESLTITAGAIYNDKLDINTPKASCYQGDPQYDTWFDAVYQSTAVAEYVTVSFDTDGGTAIPDQSIRKGTKAEKPDDPTKTGETFAGWYADDAFTTEFDFDDPITADTTVYAKFTV